MANKIEVTRVFNAPIEMVWQIWVDPELVKRWWGPKHFTSPMAVINFREGAVSLVSMKAPAEMGGQEWFSAWTYTRIVPFETIEFVQSLANREGNKVDPFTVGMPPDFPKEVETIVTFKAIEAGVTEMTVTQYAEFGSISNFAQMGLEQSADKMLAIFGQT